MMLASATQSRCHQCGAEFYIGYNNSKRVDEYRFPRYCPMCGATKIHTSSGTVFDEQCPCCGKRLKEHSVEGIIDCMQQQGGRQG